MPSVLDKVKQGQDEFNAERKKKHDEWVREGVDHEMSPGRVDFTKRNTNRWVQIYTCMVSNTIESW